MTGTRIRDRTMKNRITNDRIIIAMGEGLNVIDEITGLEMPIGDNLVVCF